MTRSVNRSRRPTPSKRTALVAVLSLVLFLAFGGLGVGGWMLTQQGPAPYALCEDAKQPLATAIVVLDTSDPLDGPLADRARATLELALAASHQGDKLSLVTLIGQDDGRAAPSTCDPGQPSDVNGMLHTVRDMAARRAKLLIDPMRAALEADIAKAGAGTSPIIETVSGVGQRPDFDQRVPTRRLFIISDMMEYVPDLLNQGKGTGDDFWTAYQHSWLPRLAPLDLHGIDVWIDYLRRPKFSSRQGDAHKAFWVRLLTKAGAASVTFIGESAPATAGAKS